MDITETLEKRIPEFYRDSKCEHDITHVKRVIDYARIIGTKEKADLSILMPAAILHDIAIKINSNKHAELGAEMARNILEKLNLENEKINKICSAILQHSIDNPTDEKRTLEGNCLFDADKLDALGSLGIARFMQESALEKNQNPQDTAKRFIEIVEVEKKLIFRTKTGKELSGKGLEEALDFCRKVIKEAERP